MGIIWNADGQLEETAFNFVRTRLQIGELGFYCSRLLQCSGLRVWVLRALSYALAQDFLQMSQSAELMIEVPALRYQGSNVL